MDDSAFMQVPNRINDGADDVSGFFLSVDLFLDYFFIEFSACEVLQDKVDILFVCIEVIELDNIGVADIFHDVDLSFE